MLNQRKQGRIAFKPMTFGLCRLVLLLITMEQNRERKVKGYVKVYYTNHFKTIYRIILKKLPNLYIGN